MAKTSRRSNIIILSASIIIAELAGIIGALFTTPSIPLWYYFLIKPSFNPPSLLFAPVWTILFLLMGIAAYYVWNEGWENRNVKIAISVYGVQLVLNVLWSFLFFGAQLPSYGFFEIVALWIVILLNIITFFRISRKAAYLLIPYILWVSFAALLNFAVWQLNPWPYGKLILDVLFFGGLPVL
ncbi:MAG: TspO/MBR family protein [Candidatus Freyarchaeum deiterrae]